MNAAMASQTPGHRQFTPASVQAQVKEKCDGNSPVIGEFPVQSASNTENISFWWRRHDDILGGGAHHQKLEASSCLLSKVFMIYLVTTMKWLRFWRAPRHTKLLGQVAEGMNC